MAASEQLACLLFDDRDPVAILVVELPGEQPNACALRLRAESLLIPSELTASHFTDGLCLIGVGGDRSTVFGGDRDRRPVRPRCSSLVSRAQIRISSAMGGVPSVLFISYSRNDSKTAGLNTAVAKKAR